jgi:hypothetical protein
MLFTSYHNSTLTRAAIVLHLDATARQDSVCLHVLPSRTALLTANAMPCFPLPTAGLQLAAGGRSYYTPSQ